MRKLLVIPWFGPLPDWITRWEQQVDRLARHGYDIWVPRDLDEFKERCRRVLDVDCPVEPGGGKVWDYRCAFGELYADEIAGYDFWGHTDFDCVYGRVEQWMTDDLLNNCDVFSNCASYVCGCWTLYRNVPDVNSLFRQHPVWRSILEDPTPTGWVETGYSRLLEAAHDRGVVVKRYEQWQAFTEPDLARLRMDGDRLMCDGRETMMAHFRRTKGLAAPVRVLEWDSEFWGVKVGTTTSPEDDCGADVEFLLLRADDTCGSRRALENGWDPMDVRVTFEAEIEDVWHMEVCDVARPGDADSVAAIARTAFIDSRFYADPRFPDDRCADFYETWARNSLGGYAEEVLVVRKDARVAGFVTLHGDVSDEAWIGLIAVADESRGHGVAAGLLAGARQWAADRPLTVATQARNIEAQRAFQHAGFVTAAVDLWFHRWRA